MTRAPSDRQALRRGWTTGACATAALAGALERLWGGAFPEAVTIALPRGERARFALAHAEAGPGWAEAGVVKDAGDDPDVTHGCLVIARAEAAPGPGVSFAAGEGVGRVTRPGLPIPPGEPAINPVPREMMRGVVADAAERHGRAPGIRVTVSVPGGAALAARTWNPRLGIEGGLSILGTTGIVRPYSCAAWIASIHRGIDVARASGQGHVAGCTGATSEAAVRALHGLPEHAMLDMGDFAGGLLKYLARHPVERVTIGGGIGKMAKLAQGAGDLHSGRSQVDLGRAGADGPPAGPGAGRHRARRAGDGGRRPRHRRGRGRAGDRPGLSARHRDRRRHGGRGPRGRCPGTGGMTSARRRRGRGGENPASRDSSGGWGLPTSPEGPARRRCTLTPGEAAEPGRASAARAGRHPDERPRRAAPAGSRRDVGRRVPGARSASSAAPPEAVRVSGVGTQAGPRLAGRPSGDEAMDRTGPSPRRAGAAA